MFSACCFRLRAYMAQGLVNRVFNVTWTHLCLQFEWFFSLLSVYTEVTPLFFYECIYLRRLIFSWLFSFYCFICSVLFWNCPLERFQGFVLKRSVGKMFTNRVSELLKIFNMLVLVLNPILFMLVFFYIFMHIVSRICHRFFTIVFIYNYCIISENLSYSGRCKLVSASVMFYN